MLPTSENLIHEVIERLAAEFQPDEMFVFGSRAWGRPHSESDLDLFVIVKSSQERPIRRDQRAQRCLGALPISADVIVRTRDEVDRVKDLAGSLTHQVLTRGRKVYG